MTTVEKSILAEQHRKDICVEHYLELHIWDSITAMAEYYQMHVDTLSKMIAEGEKVTHVGANLYIPKTYLESFLKVFK